MKLIDKDAVVAEIKKRYEYWREKGFNSHSIESEIRMSECQHLMLLLNALELKDVDLEKEIGMFTTKRLLKKRNYSTGVFHITQADINNIAKHFFEVGLKSKMQNS